MMNAQSSLRIVQVEGIATSFPVKQGVTLGIGRAVKRDAILVKVTTECGLVGWGESHHGRAPGAIAQLINTTLRQLVVGMDASDVVGVWNRIYQRQLVSHGMGQATCLAMSGIDQALWDLRGKAVGWPVYKLLGGKSRAVPAYAGGISLGFQPPAELVQEAQALVAQGYRRPQAPVRRHGGASTSKGSSRYARPLGPEVTIMVDANTGYTVSDVRAVMPAMQDAGVLWLEEPFPAARSPQLPQSASSSGGCRWLPVKTISRASSSTSSSPTERCRYCSPISRRPAA